MSVRSESYLIIGVDLNLMPKSSKEEDKIWDRLEPLMFPWCGKNADKTMGILWDGMNGDYVMAGYCVSVTDECDGFAEPVVLDLNNPAETSDVQARVEKWLDENDIKKFTDQPVRLHLLTHFH